ncbi:MAG: hypothetical protein IPP93_08065 [Chitinophagaceae bacterium]|nr:hypothetical protein [Chitinophagaceae bacterium]
MKKFLLATLFFLFYFQIQAQNVGIGTTNPVALLHVADSSVLFYGTADSTRNDNIQPACFWCGDKDDLVSSKSCIQAGICELHNGIKESIGSYFSFATGLNSKATGDGSISMGMLPHQRGYSQLGIVNNCLGFNFQLASDASGRFHSAQVLLHMQVD